MATSNVAYGLGVVLTGCLGIISILIANSKTPAINSLYGTTSTLILLYSIGASLLMYCMMMYLFTAFPTYQTLYILGFNILLLFISFVTVFFNPWKVKARKDGASGIDTSDPAFLSFAIASSLALGLYISLLLIYKNSENLKTILLLTNLLIVPSFFLTTGFINSFALNDFTHNF